MIISPYLSLSLYTSTDAFNKSSDDQLQEVTDSASLYNMNHKPVSGDAFGISFSSHFRNSIDGELTSTLTIRTGINPATEEQNPEVPVSTREDVEVAMSAADDAFQSWSRLPWTDRQECIARFADALETLTDDFARLLTMEQGKPVSRCSPSIYWYLTAVCSYALPKTRSRHRSCGCVP
jgi:hypothetical protein